MRTHDADDELMWQVARLVDELDPPPADLVERTRFALDIEDLFDTEIEVARWAEDDRELVGVRGAPPGTHTFFVDDLTVMFNVTRTGERQRIDGWLVPAGQHDVEVRVAEYGSTVTTTADEGGRFVLTDVPHGTTQLLVRIHTEQSRTVVTPTVDL